MRLRNRARKAKPSPLPDHVPPTKTPSAAIADQVGGFAVQDYIVTELNEERARRVRIDAQGASLITGSTALSVLAFAGTSLVTTQEGFDLPFLSLIALAVTFLSFMLAAFCGLKGGGQPHENQTVENRKLEEWRTSDDMWLGSRSGASREHLGYIIIYLERIRQFNHERATWIVWGSRSQIVALFGLVIAVGWILIVEMFS